ncbi:MAG TPA: NAD(P)(+) transhydrogenase (Re/Si-specific) subunit beta [Vicinamibacterales bacterium]|jgi:NAD(P) transhydrogenase subunit beta|nr:NAD(P)(+) transhydrogenase (Re/Si-specific) subunit beta [Vicinamibacterales bacterium]
MSQLVQLAYLVATALFIFALYWMNDPKTARKGVYAGVAAMAIGILGTLGLLAGFESVNWTWMAVAAVLGVAVGVPLSWVPLTAVPQRTALSHAFGGLAAGLVGTAKFYLWLGSEPEMLTSFRVFAIVAEIILGYLTFTGSLLAAGKLQEVSWIPQRPLTYKGQNAMNLGLLGIAVLCGIAVVTNPAQYAFLFPVIIVLALTFGVLLIIPIGGADMPTVIALLNSYAGLSAVAMGFVLDNKVLITAGALDGSSGLILAIIMCRAMNRSFTNVLFGAFGQVQAQGAAGEQKLVKQETPEGAALLMEQANTVVIVPGYGMAVAQAQHRVRELYDQLTKRGIDVRFAIHPVAGRMPGHMNVLLAETEIPYDHLVEMDEINPDLPQADVVLVIGANDVVNPAARHDKSSPIFGMPIIDADKAHMCFAIKRSMNPGFAGIDNELYTADHTYMLFGDAKGVVGELVKNLSGGATH